MKDRIVHMIGNAHIDAVWLWQWQEAFQEVKATFRSALDRLAESDDFVFTSSSVAYYWQLESHDPGMFEEIRQRVAEGRWVICGGWWVQADCNLPHGESFVRQGLYAQHWLRDHLGTTATVGYNPDAFGHHAMLPQILAKQGLSGYVFLRPEPHEKALPGRVFWWESDDGSRVLAFRIPHGYATGPSDLERVVRRVLPDLRDPLDEVMCFYGVGNHGGGPTRANLESIRAMDADPGMPRLVMSSPPAYFEALRRKAIHFPVVHDELQHHARGCYSAHSGIKRWNRRAEHLLMAAEAWSVVADVVASQDYPSVFPAAWRACLFNQFHDTLAGSSIEAAYEDARDLYGEAMSLGHRALNDALQSISWRIALEPAPVAAADGAPGPGSEVPIVVFNVNAWPVTHPVEVETAAPGPLEALTDDEGHDVAVQEVQSVAAVGDARRRVSFLASVPPLGYRTYRLRMTAEGAATTPPSSAARSSAGAPELVLAGSVLRAEIDPQTGCLVHLVDIAAEFDVLRGPAARPVVVSDPSDTWGHGVSSLDEEVGVFHPVSVRRIEDGPVRQAIRVDSTWGRSRLRQDFTLYTDRNLLLVAATIDWQERHHALKLRFPVDLLVPKATYEIPYGHIQRPTDGDEQPGQRWLDLTGLRPDRRSLYGLALLNDGKYGSDVRAERYRGNVHYAEMGMTVLRSPIFAHHDPYVPRADLEHAYMDQGLQRFEYALLPHVGDWEQGGVVRRAIELNHKPIAVVETWHDGPLPLHASHLEVDHENIVVSVLKQAEDDDDVVVRAYEAHRMATNAIISLPLLGRTIAARFDPCEIKTFKVPRDPVLPIVETDLLEWQATPLG